MTNTKVCARIFAVTFIRFDEETQDMEVMEGVGLTRRRHDTHDEVHVDVWKATGSTCIFVRSTKPTLLFVLPLHVSPNPVHHAKKLN